MARTPAPLKILRVNHINQIVEDYDGSIAHLQDLFGGVFLRQVMPNPVTAGCLVDVGGEIIELLAPKTLERGEGKQFAKYGPHYAGIEVLVPSVPDALAAVKDRGLRTLLERGGDFFTHPASTQGVCLQVFGGDWHADPPPIAYDNPKRSAREWEEHPIGFRGLHHMSFACTDVDEAADFWCELTGGAVTYRAERPGVGAIAVGLDLGIPVEVIAPTGPGAIADYLERYGPRVRATTFAVKDLDAAAAYFASRDVALVPGEAPGTLLLPPEHNLGLVYQFTADPTTRAAP